MCALPCNSMNSHTRLTTNGFPPGSIVPKDSITNQNIDIYFSSCDISDDIFHRIYGKSFGHNCTTPRSDLRYITILHYDINNNIRIGEMICHKYISEDLLDIFKNLFKAGYPIERMVLIDEYNADDEASMTDNNSSAFNFRFISGTKKLSNHSQGMAVDINPLYNPYVREHNGRTIVEPRAGANYTDRTASFPYKIDKNDLCYKEFIKHGFKWGGDWKDRKDYQHFEKKFPNE